MLRAALVSAQRQQHHHHGGRVGGGLLGVGWCLRGFETSAEWLAWFKDVQEARLVVGKEELEEVDGKEVAPFLLGVNPLAEHRLQYRRVKRAEAGSSKASMVEATWPLASDELVKRDVSDLQGWSAFRQGKFLEALDALTADAAYLHTDGHKRGLAMVTAAHYGSRKVERTLPDLDWTLRAYATLAGSSSMEIRTDAIQTDPDTGRERVLSVCHTTMVAVDARTLKPVKGAVPRIRDDGDPLAETRKQIGVLNAKIRKQRALESVSLHAPKLSMPPTPDEMARVHALHRDHVLNKSGSTVDMARHTHSTSLVVFPEARNVHGKTFGGWSLVHAFDLAYFAAATFVDRAPFATMGIDEATFLHPISIGDMVTIQARVVHACPATGVFRVSTSIRIHDPRRDGSSDFDNVRTNFARFLFVADGHHLPPLLPSTYEEILGYVAAQRRHNVEPLSALTRADVDAFLSEARAARAASVGPRALPPHILLNSDSTRSHLEE